MAEVKPTIKDLEEDREIKIDDLDDEITGMLRKIRVLEQDRDDTWYDFELKMFRRCWTMVKEVVRYHYPDRKLYNKSEEKLQKIFARMVGFSILKKDIGVK